MSSFADVLASMRVSHALTVAMHGDSLTSGYAVSGANVICPNNPGMNCTAVNIASEVAEALSALINRTEPGTTVTVLNHGVNGSSAQEGYDFWTPLNVAAKIKTLQYGYNDIGEAPSKQAYLDTHSAWMDLNTSRGELTIVLGSPPTTGNAFSVLMRSWIEDLRLLCVSKGVPFFDLWPSISHLPASDRLQSDGIHPSIQATKAMAAGAALFIANNLLGTSMITIVDSGSNTKGKWWKYSDGTIEQWGQFFGLPQTDPLRNDPTITFPIPFTAGAEYIGTTPIAGLSDPYSAATFVKNKSAAAFNAHTAVMWQNQIVTNGQSIPFTWMARGK